MHTWSAMRKKLETEYLAESLHSANALVRMLAYLDRRTGKRTLESLREQISAEQPWLQMIICLRLTAEGMILPEDFR